MGNRKLVQIIATFLQNGYLVGFLRGSIYTGKLKSICVPGLNCYSCPGAIASCPIGSLQAVLNDFRFNVSFYVAGLLMIYGAVMGRFVCGFLCPFGLFQELLYKIPSFKIKLLSWARYIKYLILVIFVILLPVLVKNPIGMGSPYFCAYVCPAGIVQGAIPLIISFPPIRVMLGTLFYWKGLLLLFFSGMSVFNYRFFCKVACPLGAIYGIANKASLYSIDFREDKCVDCSKCDEICKMEMSIRTNQRDSECIRCGDCVRICPTKALKAQIKLTRAEARKGDI